MRTTRYPLSAAGPGLMGGLTRGTYLITFLQVSVPELSIKFWNPEQEVASGFRCVSTAAIAGLRRSLLGVIFFLLLLSPPLHPSLPRWRSSAGFIHVPGRVYSLIMYLILWAWLICINSSAPSISVFSYSFPRVFRSFLRGSLSIESLHSRQRTTAPCWRPFCFTRPVPRGAPHFASSGDVSTLAPRGPRPERPWGVDTGHCSPCMSGPCQVVLQGGRPGFYPHLCPPQPAGGFLACRVQALFKWNRGLDELTHSVVLLSPFAPNAFAETMISLCTWSLISAELCPQLRHRAVSAGGLGPTGSERSPWSSHICSYFRQLPSWPFLWYLMFPQHPGSWVTWTALLSGGLFIFTMPESENYSVVLDSATPWAMQSMKFSRPGYWSR